MCCLTYVVEEKGKIISKIGTLDQNRTHLCLTISWMTPSKGTLTSGTTTYVNGTLWAVPPGLVAA